ncbi:hypothetical protein HRR83_003763 [Exophiala dermatitidis]|uniref:Chlorohydrolase n=2 Tax=Exophiala dermatitidis TaxID=5970 RepID=H6BPA1_EXODN|nr:chlorohydrolase [Exophiala dermatitidis NIH/UT8656]KAJ4518936.1 hypothetical protein HRR75_002612 [Exophiala dermatitidis]EHY53556.1 chlorohydrolase [Exophiala dermatitidis NIH/UT8656]KAJ4522272.1 hypothetical protein HRR74_002855 [Exophiala dermatitidis]KAJ4529597.1 hypothetical protein HRR73_000623 [Exophiala dermatitidis]KAJ4543241.1 hypothetical protein HRR77_005496 [Exophiala dermatitidis]
MARSAPAPILLRGGTVLQYDANDQAHVLKNTDLLVQNGLIAKIGKGLTTPPETKIIDCQGKLISPGFVDTHHHVWQTQLKGRHSDDTLLDYTAKGNWQPFNYTAKDVFWGEMGGLMEAVDGGTTCVVDHAHMAYSPEHALAGFSATVTTGIRSVFCLGLTPRIDKWDDNEVVPNPELIPEWFLPTLRDLSVRAGRLSLSNNRISIGLGFDSYTLPREDIVRFFTGAREAGAKIITSHWRRNNIAGTGLSVPEALEQYGLLGSDIILSHATGSTEDELQLLKSAGAYISATPATESQMAHGEVVGFRKDVLGSIGADCQSNNPGSLLHSMQVGLAVCRSHRNSRILSSGKFPKEVEPTTLHAFNLATIHGARAIGAADKLGSLTEGKAADIVVFDTDTPAVCCAVEYDPVVAIVRHATVREVNTVIVGGSILKEEGRLLDVHLDLDLVDSWKGSEEASSHGGSRLSWGTVLNQLRSTQEEIQKRIDGCNLDVAKEKILHMWGAKNGNEILV